jgi:hypothetical protein
VVAAVHFYATATDQAQLLDYLGEGTAITLRPWPVVGSLPISLSRDEALTCDQVMVVSASLGPPVVLRDGDVGTGGSSRARAFNWVNWERLRPHSDEGLVDSNRSPVLLWSPATRTSESLSSGHIGTQADSMKAVSADYERWVYRVMSWVRRRGTVVWGWKPEHQRSDLDLRRTDVTTVYALPEALALLQRGSPGL